MKLLSFLQSSFGKKHKKRANIADYKQELLVKQGTEQFKTLLKKGLSIPVALL